MMYFKRLTFTLLFVLGICGAVVAQGSSSGKVLPVAEHYEGGQEKLLADIQKSITYPGMAKRNRIQGECIVSLTLTDDGRMINYKLLKNVGGGCGEEAMRVVKTLKFKAPGYRVDATVPVRFVLPSRTTSN